MLIEAFFMFYLDSVSRTSEVITISVGILALLFTICELITAAVQRRIYTELSPLPLVADPTRTDSSKRIILSLFHYGNEIIPPNN